MREVELAHAGPLLVDLLNSRSLIGRELLDELVDDAAAAGWLRRHGGTGSAEEIHDVRRVRAALAAFLRGEAGTDALSPWLAGLRREPRIVANRLTWVTRCPAASAIGVRAILEWAAVQELGGDRLRECAEPTCKHFFVDRSKANARKWCDMNVCGNRVKARRHHQRAKAEAGAA